MYPLTSNQTGGCLVLGDTIRGLGNIWLCLAHPEECQGGEERQVETVQQQDVEEAATNKSTKMHESRSDQADHATLESRAQ